MRFVEDNKKNKLEELKMLTEKELRNKARQIAKITGENAKDLYIKIAEEQDKEEEQ